MWTTMHRALRHVERALQAEAPPSDATLLLHFKVLLMRQDIEAAVGTLQDIARQGSADTLKA